MATRDALIDSVRSATPVPTTARAADAGEWLTAAAAFRADPRTTLTNDDAAALLNSLETNPALRDQILISLTDGERGVPRDLLLHLAARANTYHPGIHAVVATAEMLRGNTVRALASLDRVHDRTHTLTRLLKTIGTQLTPSPTQFADLLSTLSGETCPFE